MDRGSHRVAGVLAVEPLQGAVERIDPARHVGIGALAIGDGDTHFREQVIHTEFVEVVRQVLTDLVLLDGERDHGPRLSLEGFFVGVGLRLVGRGTVRHDDVPRGEFLPLGRTLRGDELSSPTDRDPFPCRGFGIEGGELVLGRGMEHCPCVQPIDPHTLCAAGECTVDPGEDDDVAGLVARLQVHVTFDADDAADDEIAFLVKFGAYGPNSVVEDLSLVLRELGITPEIRRICAGICHRGFPFTR